MAKATEFGRANADYVTRSLSGIGTGGVLVTCWWKHANALGNSDSRGNAEVMRIFAGDWSIRGIVGNGATNAAGIGNLNCNLMLFSEPGSGYLGDFAYYDTTGYTKEQLNGWNWVAWWIQPGSTFTMRQWLRVAGAGGVFLATSGGTDTSTDIAGADDPPTDMSWSDDASSTPDNAYLWHGTVRAMASEPTIAQLDALCLATAPDVAAFGDWPLEFVSGALSTTDQSGNARSISLNGGSTFYQGPDAPALATVYMGASAIDYSATSPAPDYSTLPNSIAANDGIGLVIGQKPATANGGTVTTPSGYTLVGSKLAAGGYGATLGADTGNTNLYFYKKTTVTGSESGTLSITTSDNSVAFAYFVHFRSANGTYDLELGTAEDTTAGNLSLAFTSIDVQAGDVLIAAFCEPTDVTTPSQFSAQAISGTGLTTNVLVELNEPDSALGNDIGGVSYVAEVSAGSGSTAITLTATAGGTNTNVRGPGLLVRVRQGASAVTPPAFSVLSPARSPNRRVRMAAWASAMLFRGVQPTIAGVSGSGSAAGPSFAVAGSGTVTFSGSGANAMVPFAAAGSGAETFSGAAAAAASPAAAAAAGTETFTGTGAGAVSPFGGSAAGAETFTASGAAAAQPFGSSVTGTETFTGASAADAAPFGASAAALETFTGTLAAALQPFAAAASGSSGGIIGTGAASVSSFAGSASGIETFSAAVAAALSAFGAASSGGETFTGTGSAAAQPFDAAATGVSGSGISGTASAEAAPFGASATGSETFTGTASAADASFGATASALETFSGAIAAALQAFAAAASGTSGGIIGTGSAAVSPFGSSASAAETFSASMTAALQAFASSSTGGETFSGTGSAAAVPFDTAGTGGVGSSITGTAAAAVAAFAALAVAVETFSGAATVAAQPLGATGAGAEAFTATASAALPPPGAAGAGLETFVAQVAAALAPFAVSGLGINGDVIITGTATIIVRSFAAAGALWLLPDTIARLRQRTSAVFPRGRAGIMVVRSTTEAE